MKKIEKGLKPRQEKKIRFDDFEYLQESADLVDEVKDAVGQSFSTLDANVGESSSSAAKKSKIDVAMAAATADSEGSASKDKNIPKGAKRKQSLTHW